MEAYLHPVLSVSVVLLEDTEQDVLRDGGDRLTTSGDSFCLAKGQTSCPLTNLSSEGIKAGSSRASRISLVRAVTYIVAPTKPLFKCLALREVKKVLRFFGMLQQFLSPVEMHLQYCQANGSSCVCLVSARDSPGNGQLRWSHSSRLMLNP